MIELMGCPVRLALLMERWISWRKRHVLPLQVLAALTVLIAAVLEAMSELSMLMAFTGSSAPVLCLQ